MKAVRRRRPDGFHDLETIFAFAEDGDLLTAKGADDVTLATDGPFGSDIATRADNLVMLAAIALRERFGIKRGAAITLTKRLPVASGIGGGSADAAAALRLLCRLWGIDSTEPGVTGIAADLGADVPACLVGRTTFGTGRGDALIPFSHPYAGAPLLLVNPLIAVSTAKVFSAWDGKDRGVFAPDRPEVWRNDLTLPASTLAPQIADILQRLEAQPSTRFVRMSGSGATCFAIFADTAARDAALTAFPDCWTLATWLA
jgi:4-diphosphocytidyl-2-C-methyl-D-erythritol kinase